MAVALIAGAAAGVALDKLVKVVVEQQGTRIAGFNDELKRLETTLIDIKPKLIKITELKKEEKITRYLMDAADLVRKCSKVKWWNAYHKSVNAKRLISLDNDLLRFFQVNAQADAIIEIGIMQKKLDQLLAAAVGTGGFSGWCNVPGLPENIVGLDVPLAELKDRMLKEETRVLVISAPGGCGKTTLAQMFCHDDDIKDVFGKNIFYITVSRDSSMKHIARKLFGHFDKHDFEFHTEEEAKNQIENLLKQKIGSDNMLLVLDDVWPGSESLIEDLKFNIPGFKILVTSRFSFQSFDSLYEMSFLNEEDARNLFCRSAFPSNGNPVNMPDDDLVTEMVKVCKGLPLTLTVVGASLRGYHVDRWKTTLKKWSKGRSILQSHNSLLLSHQISIDALDELDNNVKECFLDLGSFPEDDRIAGAALMDMWVELYNLDDEDARDNLFELSLRNLINLLLIRETAGEIEGQRREQFVTQHDLLRDLAIHLSSQEPEAKRGRLFFKIDKNDFPKWWTEEFGQPINSGPRAEYHQVQNGNGAFFSWIRCILEKSAFLRNFILHEKKSCGSRTSTSTPLGPPLPINASVLSISTDETFNSTWYDLNAPNVEVLILNIRSKNYALPQFIKRMSQLKVLIVTGYGVYPSQIDNLHFLGSLTNLRRIRFEHVSVSPSIQVIFALQNLKKLTFVTCEIGNALKSGTTEYPYMLPNLIDLEIDCCYDLKELPAELCSFVHLEKLSITNCHELDDLPKGLGSLSNLQTLRLHCCTKLQQLPESIGNLHDLSLIDISDCLSISALPEQIGELSGLRALKMSGCRGLQEFPVCMSKLSQLEVICDEETSYLWERIWSENSKVKINIVEEDRLENFKKICQ